MSTSILVIGESGAGKSTSIRTLNPQETFIISVLNKDLPFKEGRFNYVSKDRYDKIQDEKLKKSKKVNFYSVKPALTAANSEYLKVSEKVIDCIKLINKDRPDIKNIVIDDCQYIMSNEFMVRDKSEGYDKFTNIAKDFWSIIEVGDACRDNLNIIYLSHSEKTDDGKVGMMTLGKMLKEKDKIEGRFTFVFHACCIDDKYAFEVNNTGNSIAKSPYGMFEKRYIPNDLKLVVNKINEYFGDVPF